jgi:hypothetical protein
MTRNTLKTVELFGMGRIMATPGALETLRAVGMSASTFLARHESGDWGNLDAEDRRANDRALMEGTRIFSSYALGDTGERVWIITEADRSYTTVLRPDEY